MIDHAEFEDALSDVIDYLYPWEKFARKDFEYYALKQWEEDDRKRLEGEGRPALIFDRTRPIIDSVAGAEVTNRYEPKFIPRQAELEEPDPHISEGASELYRYIRNVGDTEHHESGAFRSTLICGVGCTETHMDFENHKNGIIMTSRVPVFEMGWDPASVQQNFRDARFIIRDRWLPYGEVESLFGPKQAKNVIEMAKSSSLKSSNAPRGLFARLMTREVEDSRHAYMDKKGRRYFDPRTNHIRLWEMQRKERKYFARITLPGPLNPDEPGQPTEKYVPQHEADSVLQGLHEAVAVYNNDPMNQMTAMQTGQPFEPIQLDYVENFPVIKVYRSFHTGVEVVKEEELPVRDFTYQFMTCFEDWSEQERRYFFGLMRPMRDPQNYANKFFSQAVHVWAGNPKGALLYEEDMFENKETAQREWNKPTGMIPVPTGTLSQHPKDKYVQLNSNVSLGGVKDLLAHAIDAIPTSAGVNQQYGVGQVEDLRRTPASSIESIQRANMVTISQPFDALRLYKKNQSKLVLDFIGQYMDPAEIMRVLGPEKSQVLLPAIESGELLDQYDIVIEESPSSPNKQMEVFGKMMEANLIPQMSEMGIPVPPSVAKYFPFPPDINTEFQGVLETNKMLVDMQNQINMMMMQMQAAQLQMGMAPGAPGEEEGAPPPEGEVE